MFSSRVFVLFKAVKTKEITEDHQPELPLAPAITNAQRYSTAGQFNIVSELIFVSGLHCGM